jgi:hypothetical protein
MPTPMANSRNVKTRPDGPRGSAPCHFCSAAYDFLVRGKWPGLLPILFITLAVVSRWPGLFPLNFSVFYGLAFCAGAFFPRAAKWWLPLGTLLVTDLALDLYYYFALGIAAFKPTQLINYAAFALIIALGKRFSARSSFVSLLAGGLLGALIFYLVTNTAAWIFNPFHNPEYTRDLWGWLRALTTGTGGGSWPATWEFFRNTLLSGGLFTGVFAGALKLTEPSSESARDKQSAPDSEAAPGDEPLGEPEEAKA